MVFEILVVVIAKNIGSKLMLTLFRVIELVRVVSPLHRVIWRSTSIIWILMGTARPSFTLLAIPLLGCAVRLKIFHNEVRLSPLVILMQSILILLVF